MASWINQNIIAKIFYFDTWVPHMIPVVFLAYFYCWCNIINEVIAVVQLTNVMAVSYMVGATELGRLAFCML